MIDKGLIPNREKSMMKKERERKAGAILREWGTRGRKPYATQRDIDVFVNKQGDSRIFGDTKQIEHFLIDNMHNNNNNRSKSCNKGPS